MTGRVFDNGIAIFADGLLSYIENFIPVLAQKKFLMKRVGHIILIQLKVLFLFINSHMLCNFLQESVSFFFKCNSLVYFEIPTNSLSKQKKKK